MKKTETCPGQNDNEQITFKNLYFIDKKWKGKKMKNKKTIIVQHTDYVIAAVQLNEKCRAAGWPLPNPEVEEMLTYTHEGATNYFKYVHNCKTKQLWVGKRRFDENENTKWITSSDKDQLTAAIKLNARLKEAGYPVANEKLENFMKRFKEKNKSQQKEQIKMETRYTGVYPHNGNWMCQRTVGDKQRHSIHFGTEESAAHKSDQLVFEMLLEGARPLEDIPFNFPQSVQTFVKQHPRICKEVFDLSDDTSNFLLEENQNEAEILMQNAALSADEESQGSAWEPPKKSERFGILLTSPIRTRNASKSKETTSLFESGSSDESDFTSDVVLKEVEDKNTFGKPEMHTLPKIQNQDKEKNQKITVNQTNLLPDKNVSDFIYVNSRGIHGLTGHGQKANSLPSLEENESINQKSIQMNHVNMPSLEPDESLVNSSECVKSETSEIQVKKECLKHFTEGQKVVYEEKLYIITECFKTECLIKRVRGDGKQFLIASYPQLYSLTVD